MEDSKKLDFEELLRTAQFVPIRVETSGSSWLGHLPFAAWLIRHLKPSIFVELGTHSGNSYSTFCQAVKEANLSTKCYAIDTWKEDEHAGYYDEDVFSSLKQHHDANYSGFSRLLRMTFDEGVSYFSDQSIGLLHIDGLHTYEAVRHDFEKWLPKLAPGAVVLFHDINVKQHGFGVWQFWNELKSQYPDHLEFLHSYGLSVLQLNNGSPEKLEFLHNIQHQKMLIRYFSSLGAHIIQDFERRENELRLKSEIVVKDDAIKEFKITQNNLVAEREQLQSEIASLRSRLDEIFKSTAWRAANLLSIVGSKVPPLLKVQIERFLKPIYRFLRSLLPRQNAFIVGKLYNRWVKEFDTLSDIDRAKIRARIDQFDYQPLISVVMPVHETPEQVLREAIDSLLAQLYNNWELCVADDASASPHVRKVLESYTRQDSRIKCVFRETNGHISAASNSALAIANGDYVALLDHDDVLSEHALYLVAEAILQNPTADIFYSDEDKLDANGKRVDPHFKPDWNPQLFLGQNFINHLTVYKRSAIEHVGGFRLGFEGSQDYDLALRVIGSTHGPIVHIPFILYHWRIFRGATTMSSTQADAAKTAARRALIEYFAEKGEPVLIGDVLDGYHRVVRPDPLSWSKVSVIIPTRDYLEVLEVVIEGLLEKTDYPNLEIIIADNDSSKTDTLNYFKEVERRGVKILTCPGAFNFSSINNKAVAQSTGELVLLLNNDVSIIEPNWLKEMVRYFGDPTVGAVGAKLLYPDGTLQHAGVVIGIGGVAGHRYVGYPGGEPGSFGRLALAQDVSCVTGACLVIRRSVFDEVGGLDEKNLPVAFNDVDLCLKIRQAGHRIIWTPFSVLHHHESKSRGHDLQGEKQLRFQRDTHFMLTKWGEKLRCDPFYSPNLSLDSTSPNLANPPRLHKPWLI